MNTICQTLSVLMILSIMWSNLQTCSRASSLECKIEASLLSVREGPLLITEGSVIEINCTGDLSSQVLGWVVTVPGKIPLRFNSVILTDLGIYDHGMTANNTIQLHIRNATGDINGTVVQCEYTRTATSIARTKLMVYEPTPVTVYAEDIGIQAANISWRPSRLSPSLMFEDINQTYLLTVTSTNTTQPLIHQLHHSYYVFTAPEGSPPCEVYNFSVTTTYVGATYTGAGCSVPSLVLSKMLPSLPDIKVLNSSLIYSSVGDLKLNLSFECGMCCEVYPVLNYTLEVRSSSSEVVTHSIAPQHHNLIGNLSENREYSFQIVIENAFGNISSSIRQFNTADVQLVRAIFNESTKRFSVQCDFIPGSDAQGCMVVLVGELGNTTVNLTKLDTVAVEMINVTCPLKNYTQVIGYDIESDKKSIGPLAVHGKFVFNDSKLCPLITHEIGSSLSIMTVLLTILIPTTVISIIIILIVLLVAIFYKLGVKHKRKRNNVGKMTINEVYGVSSDSIETTPNEVYGVVDGIEMTPNEVYGVVDDIEITPNEVYGFSTDGIETTPNEVYGVSINNVQKQHNEQRLDQSYSDRINGPSPPHAYEDVDLRHK